jgi:hypothetical protein
MQIENSNAQITSESVPVGNMMLCDVVSLHPLEGEVWNDVFGFDGLFSVSNFGRVKREFRYNAIGRKVQEKILSRIYCKNNKKEKVAAIVRIRVDNKCYTKTVSSLVCEAFIRPLNENECAIHIDKKSLFDDSLTNVKIGTYSDYVQNAKKPLLGNKGITGRNKTIQQLDLNGNVIREFISLGEIERVLGFKKSAISAYINNRFQGRPFKHPYGYEWKIKT